MIWIVALICFLSIFSVYFCNSNLSNSFFKSISKRDSFEKLLGRETDYWKYMKTTQDWLDLNFYKNIYEKSRHFQYESTSSFRIPKTIHAIWLGPRPFPIESIQNMRTWLAHHPDWDFCFWTDRERIPPCEGMRIRLVQNFKLQFFEKAYEQARDWGEKADLLLYEILYREGGVYIDHDANCLSFFDPLHRGYDFYAALEMPHHGPNNWALTVGLGVVGSRPHHPIVREAVHKVLEGWNRVTQTFKDGHAITQQQLNLHRTYLGLTLALKEPACSIKQRDIIFPAAYFYPKGNLPAFYSRHFYAGAWHTLGETPNQQKLRKKMKHIERESSKTGRCLHTSLLALIGCFPLCFLINRSLKKWDQTI